VCVCLDIVCVRALPRCWFLCRAPTLIEEWPFNFGWPSEILSSLIVGAIQSPTTLWIGVHTWRL
jgi:hypothetical protein